jgi:recombination protein RecT
MSNAVTKTNGGNKPTILQFIEKYKDQIAAALPKHITPDRMVRVVTTSIRKNPELTNCNPQSLFGAIVQTSQLGLEPDNGLGHAYLVPFRNKHKKTKDVQLIIGYRGFIDLAWRSQKVIGIDAEVVYSNDQFHYSRGLNPTLEHVPSEGDDRGERTHAYCIIHMKDGGTVWRVLTRRDVMAAKEFSAAAKSGPWVTHEDDMWRKTAVRAVMKYAPLSIDIQQAVGVDEQSEVGRFDTSKVIDGDFMPVDDSGQGDEPASKTERLKNRLSGDAEPDKQPEQSPEPEKPTGNGPPTEAELFGQVDLIIANPERYDMGAINELAALTDAISGARRPEYHGKLKQARQAVFGEQKEPAVEPTADAGVQGAFFSE